MKSFAMLIMSGALFASGAYIAPAMADDAGDGDIMMSLAENDMQTGNNTMGNDGSSQSDNANNNSTNNNANDTGGPDTATGDDDY